MLTRVVDNTVLGVITYCSFNLNTDVLLDLEKEAVENNCTRVVLDFIGTVGDLNSERFMEIPVVDGKLAINKNSFIPLAKTSEIRIASSGVLRKAYHESAVDFFSMCITSVTINKLVLTKMIV